MPYSRDDAQQLEAILERLKPLAGVMSQAVHELKQVSELASGILAPESKAWLASFEMHAIQLGALIDGGTSAWASREMKQFGDRFWPALVQHCGGDVHRAAVFMLAATSMALRLGLRLEDLVAEPADLP